MDQFYFEVNLIFLAKSKVRSGRKPGKLSWAQNSKALIQLTCIFQPMDQFFQVLLGLFPGCVTILDNAGVAKKCVKLLMIFAFGTQDFTHRYHCLKSGFKIFSCQCWRQTVKKLNHTFRKSEIVSKNWIFRKNDKIVILNFYAIILGSVLLKNHDF